MHNQYGHFGDDGLSFVVTNPATPRAFDNFLWNDAVFSCVQQTGIGTCDAQIDGREAIQVFSGVGRVVDIETFGRDHLMSRLVYVRDMATGAFWNVGWEPVCRPCSDYACTHGLGWTRIVSETDGIRASLLIFVPPGREAVECWHLSLENRSGRPRSLGVFVYNQYALQYKWGFNGYGDMIYRGAWFNESLNAMVVQKHPYIAPHRYLTAFLTADHPAVGHDGSRDHFVGTYRTLKDPQAVVDGACTDSPGSSEATVGVLQFSFELAADASETVRLLTGLTDSEAAIADVRRRCFANFAAAFEALVAEKRAMVAHNAVETPDPHFDRLANGWLKQQTLYGATWCRWGWMGYRDIVQHGHGVSSFEPARTRAILLDACAHLHRNGVAVRGWNPLDQKPYSDSPLWLAFALVDYVKETGDFALLEASAPYLDGGEGTVSEHLDAALQYLWDGRGAHGLCLIRFGDWNDSLTNIGKAGRGESVWLSMAFVRACDLMATLWRRLGHAPRAVREADRAQTVRQAVRETAWDGDWYLRCFDDEGRPVGSRTNEEGRIFVNAQSWAMLCGAADDAQAASLLAACDAHLMTDLGYRLVAPPFRTRDDRIGRISYLEPGICENGTIYSHGNAFMVYALLMRGESDRAYDIFRRIAPGYVPDAASPKAASPAYIFANCYYGPDHRNRPLQMEFTWITGSVAWFVNDIQDWLVGVRRDYDGLVIDPKLPSAWNEVRVHRTFRGREFDVRIARTGRRRVVLNGEPLEGDFIALERSRGTNAVDVEI